ncbi:hypothetical protein FEM48_Zijuj07G0022100 [Ziziphus jujuba var. spinosa]|uniref:Peptidase A1 domain-containing protein n=1 Tax=Ziziphus jujuba var. spinosa TaxID=714518 RepID=A0A978V1V3_ZIZJJ|nr:hypothetical protein FEM48_Zijuj07G0022100 [Ziziphus jujuba var. spinosa]
MIINSKFFQINQSFLFINITVGVPATSQFQIVDTRSNFLWIQCLLCKNCIKQFSPMFNPSKSSVYNAIYCNSNLICPYKILLGSDAKQFPRNIECQNLSLFGLYAQRSYNIAYDLFGKILVFKMIDCDVLDQTW